MGTSAVASVPRLARALTKVPKDHSTVSAYTTAALHLHKPIGPRSSVAWLCLVTIQINDVAYNLHSIYLSRRKTSKFKTSQSHSQCHH